MRARALGVRKSSPMRGVKVTYRVYLKNGVSKYRSMCCGISVEEENPVEFLTQYLKREWKEHLTYETYQDTDYFKLISIDGEKVNVEIRR